MNIKDIEGTKAKEFKVINKQIKIKINSLEMYAMIT